MSARRVQRLRAGRCPAVPWRPVRARPLARTDARAPGGMRPEHDVIQDQIDSRARGDPSTMLGIALSCIEG
jgi:hypothetical protein